MNNQKDLIGILKEKIPKEVLLHLAFGGTLAFMGNLFLFLGMIGNLSSRSIFISVIFTGIGFFIGLLLCLKNDKKEKFFILGKISWVEITLFFILVLFIWLTLFQGIVPPHARDALIHHLAIPLWYLKGGRVLDFPFAEQAYNPMLVDFLYLIPLVLRDKWIHLDAVSSWIHYFFALGTAHLLFLFLKDQFDFRVGLVSAIFFLSLPIVIQSGSQAYVDLGVTYYACLCWTMLYLWFFDQENESKKLLLFFAGLMGGCAMASKYNGFLIVPLTGMLLLFRGARLRSPSKAVLLSVGIFFLGALLAVSPWLIKNFLWTGNPIYPYFRSFLGWKGVPLESIGEVPALFHRYKLYQESIWDILLLPVRIFFTGKEGNPAQFDGSLSPILILLIPFCFIYKKSSQKYLIQAILFIIGFYFIYTAFFRILRMRYLLPVVPLLVILAVMGWQNLRNKEIRAIAGVLLGGFVLFHLFQGVQRFQNLEVLPFLTGKVDRDQYLESRLVEYPVQKWANKTLTNQEKILFVLLGHRGYYCEIPYTYDFHDPGRSWRRWLKKARSSQHLNELIRQEGISHLMIHRYSFMEGVNSWFMLKNAQVDILKKFLRTHTKVVFQNESIQLYEIY